MLKFLYAITLIAVGAAVGAGFFLFSDFSQEDANAELIFQVPDKVVVGVPFELSVGINNNSSNLWRDVQLSLSLPDSIIFFDDNPERAIKIDKLGNLGSRSLTQSKFTLMAVGTDSGQVAPLKAVVSYTPEGVGSRFQSEEEFEINPETSIVDLEVQAPEKLAVGEEIRLNVNYKNVGEKDLSGLQLKIGYPANFIYKSASIEPDESDNVWNLGSLRAGSAGSLSIRGQLLGGESTEVEFDFMILRQLQGNKYPLQREGAKVTLLESPLMTSVALAGDLDYAQLGETLNYVVYYSKKQDTKFSGSLQIKAKLNGAMFDLNTLNVGSGGSARAINEVVWQIPETDTGDEGSVQFSIKVKDQYEIKRLSDRNFVLKVEAQATQGQYSSAAKTETKLLGQVKIEAKGYFRDAASGILNSGPLPPKIGMPTQYTVHWLVTNYSNDIKSITIKAPLMGGVTYMGIAKSNISTKPTHNGSTNEMTWTIERISATTGITNKPLEAIFQIQATPQSGQLGQFMPLLGITTITAEDDFVGANINGVAPPLTTQLPDDPTVGASGIVVQ